MINVSPDCREMRILNGREINVYHLSSLSRKLVRPICVEIWSARRSINYFLVCKNWQKGERASTSSSWRCGLPSQNVWRKSVVFFQNLCFRRWRVRVLSSKGTSYVHAGRLKSHQVWSYQSVVEFFTEIWENKADHNILRRRWPLAATTKWLTSAHCDRVPFWQCGFTSGPCHGVTWRHQTTSLPLCVVLIRVLFSVDG